jgi:hypothetical protein
MTTSDAYTAPVACRQERIARSRTGLTSTSELRRSW